MMEELHFDTGYRTFKVNDTHEITFHPSDSSFVKKLFKMMENIKAICDKEAPAAQPDGENSDEMFDYAEARDKSIRREIDAVFGDGIADALIKSDCMALSGGWPVWLNFAVCILDKMDENLVEQQKQANPRMEAYMAKYEKYAKFRRK